MKNNFDLKKFLLENRLTAPSEIHEEEGGVQEVYDKIIADINNAARKLTDKQASELHDKLKKFFVGGIINVNERDLEQHPMGGQKAGLRVAGRSTEDNTKIGQMIRDQDLQAQWNARDGYWFFPEDGDRYDAKEQELEDGFHKYGIKADIEGVF